MEAESEGTLRPIEHVRRREASPRSSDAAGFEGAASSPVPDRLFRRMAGAEADQFDIATALVLIVVSLPLFLIIALAESR